MISSRRRQWDKVVSIDVLPNYEHDDDAATVRYDRNSGGFQHTLDSDEKMKLKLGHTFYTVYDFRNVWKAFAIKNGFILKRLKNEKSRVMCKCAANDCTWRIYAGPTWDRLYFQTKTYNPTHKCGRVFDNYEANSAWIAAKFLHLFKENLNLYIKVIASELFRKYKVTCPPLRLYRARNKALRHLGANHKASYNKLERYIAAIMYTNPSSIANLQIEWTLVNDKPTFTRFFICFNAQRRGYFDGCKQFIGLDGCHLRGPFKGVLLAAIIMDSNYEVYPLAMVVVENEIQHA